MDPLDLLLDQSRKELEMQIRAIEDIGKRAGLSIVANGLLLSIFFNLSAPGQLFIYSNSSSWTKEIVFQLIGSILFIFSVFCFGYILVLLINGRKQYQFLKDSNPSNIDSSPLLVNEIKERIVQYNIKHVVSLGDKINNAEYFFRIGIVVFLLSCLSLVSDIIILLVHHTLYGPFFFLIFVIFILIATFWIYKMVFVKI